MASTSIIADARNGTGDKNGLCLLSLDGGGVRGLSTLLILKAIMQQVNEKRRIEELPYVKPCDLFDLIGGTSTGGLIAIMLGRLQMDIQPCIDAYSELSRSIFSKSGLPVNWRGHVKGRYNASDLENAVRKMIRTLGLPEDTPLNDGEDRGSRVFVCAVRKENKAVARLRAYRSDAPLSEHGATIWEAARATSAASGFFDPIAVGQHGQKYVDAGLGCNNPVNEVWTEAQNIWSPQGEELAPLVKCFISIGTGNPGISPIEDVAFKVFTKTLKEIVTETEITAETFAKSHRGLLFQERYFRFNVDQGLQAVGLEEYKKENEIASATMLYMEFQDVQRRTQICSDVLKDKAFWRGSITDLRRRMLVEQQPQRELFQLVFSLIAAPEIDYFVGRASDLSTIDSVLLPFTGPERKVAVLHGLGGIGKSQLAIQFAKEHRDDYTAVFWLNAKTEDTLKRSFAANARRLPEECFSQGLLDGPQDEEAFRTILYKMKEWLGLPGNDRWLLIYDNVDNPKIPDNKRESAYDIRSYLPEAHQGSILVTTRWKTLRIGRPIEVAKLSSDDESMSLLVRMSRRDLEKDPRIQDLIKKLDGLPLALATAGGYLGMIPISVSEYLDHYEESWPQLQRDGPPLLSYEDQTIYSTWNLSYIYIRRENQSAAKLLELWAYFDNRDLWYDLLKAGEDTAPSWFLDIIETKLAFNSVLGKLQKHALVEKLAESDGYSMHNCVHAWVTNVLCKAVEDRNAVLACECITEIVPPQPAPRDWIIKQRILPHAERCLDRLRLWRKGSKDLGQIDLCIAEIRNCLGKLYQNQGKTTAAVSMLECVLAYTQRTLGEHNQLTLDTVNNLGVLYLDQGKLAEAESMYQRALVGYEKNPGKNHIFILATINDLGILYRKQGKLAEAESMYQRALSGKEKALGKDHISTLQTMSNLGVLYQKQGKLVEAESIYQRLLIEREKALGKDHTLTLDTVTHLATTYRLQGRPDKAEPMYQRALTGFTQDPHARPEKRFDLSYKMGLYYWDQQDFDRAKGFLKQAYKGYQSLFGSEHNATIDALNRLNILTAREAESSDGQDR